MMVTLYNGVSGIKTNNYGIDVTANNIANTNTVGFKGSQAEFKDIFYQTNMVGGFNPVASSVGLGATVGGTALNLKQGNFQNTDNFLDLTIAGDGYFKVSGTANPDVYYTRAGEFFVDKNRDVVNSQGFYLMGNLANFTQTGYSQAAMDNLGMGAKTTALTLDPNAPVNFGTTQTKLTLPDNLYIPPEPTSQVAFKGTLSNEMNYGFVTKPLNLENGNFTTQDNGIVSFKANVTDTPEFVNFSKDEQVIVSFTNENGDTLNAAAAIKDNGDFEIANFDISKILSTDPDKFKNIKISATAKAKEEVPTTAKFTSSLFSSTGYDNTLTINFTKQVPTNPQGISWNMSASITDRQGNPLSRANGVISFNGDGALVGNTLGGLMNGDTPLNIDFGSFFDPTKPNSGFDGVIIGEKSALSDISKNGYADGVLKSYAISGAGSVVAQFSNGVQATVAKIPVFHFQNDQGLYTEGGVFFSQTLNSGEAFMYVDQNGNPYNGTEIKSYVLETSNVDLGNEMTMLIVQQRAYEASAKSISTGDQMLQRAINMKNDR